MIPWWDAPHEHAEDVKRVHHNTLVRFSDRWLWQDIGNLPAVATSPDVAALSTLSGFPGIVVAPGPSLDGNIAALKEAQGRVVIVAVSHALRALVAAGVRPDLVVVLDAEDSDHFDGVDPDEFGGLVLPSVAGPKTMAVKARRRWFFQNFGAEWLYAGLPSSAILTSGGTVSGAALSLLLNSGCWPIAVAGLDLSFCADGRMYSQHSQDAETALRHGAGDALEGECADGAPVYVGASVELPGYHGGHVPSCRIFGIYHEWFERVALRVAERLGPIANCTEGGVHIDGMDHITLAEWLRRAPHTLPIDAALNRASKLPPEHAAALPAHVDGLRARLSGVEAAASVCASLADGGFADALIAAEASLKELMAPVAYPLSALRLVEFQSIRDAMETDDRDKRLKAASRLYRFVASSCVLLRAALTQRSTTGRDVPPGLPHAEGFQA